MNSSPRITVKNFYKHSQFFVVALLTPIDRITVKPRFINAIKKQTGFFIIPQLCCCFYRPVEKDDRNRSLSYKLRKPLLADSQLSQRDR